MKELIWTAAFITAAVLGFMQYEEAARLDHIAEAAKRQWPIHTVGLKNGLYLYFAFLISRRYLSLLELSAAKTSNLIIARYLIVPLLCFSVVLIVDKRLNLPLFMTEGFYPFLFICWLMLSQSSNTLSNFVMVRKWVTEQDVPEEELKSQLLVWHLAMTITLGVIVFTL